MVEDGDDLPGEATIILHVSGSRTLPRSRSPDFPCERIDAEAFRCDEDGISVTWVEYFPGEGADQLRLAALAMRGAITIRKSGIVARIHVEELLSALADEAGGVRVIRDRQDHNEGHCLITGIGAGDIGALMVLAEAFTDFIPATAIPGLVN